jgi:hypothetical protein
VKNRNIEIIEYQISEKRRRHEYRIKNYFNYIPDITIKKFWLKNWPNTINFLQSL